MSDRYVIIGRDDCKWCDKAQVLLSERGKPITKFNISTNETIKDFLLMSGFKTVPQIFHQGKLIGGYDALEMVLLQEEANEQT